MSQQSAEQLLVRQHERYHCRLACHVRVGEQTAEQVTPARSVGDGAGTVDAVIVDCSRGGLGLESNVFYPRGCRLRIRIKPSAAGGEGAPKSDLLVRVQRATMTDRKPTYYLGVSFVGSGMEHDQTVAASIALAKAASAAPATGNSGKEAA